VHALALRRADGRGEGGAERRGEIAGIEPLALMAEIGIGIDIDLAADLFPDPAEALILGEIAV
jgi:hypothetical protein